MILYIISFILGFISEDIFEFMIQLVNKDEYPDVPGSMGGQYPVTYV